MLPLQRCRIDFTAKTKFPQSFFKRQKIYSLALGYSVIESQSGLAMQGLTVVFTDNQTGVVAAEAEGIAQGEVDFCLAGLQWHIIHLQVAPLVLII
jgi:hypothetical protein